MTDHPENQTGRTGDAFREDALSRLLAWVRLRGRTVYQARLAGPWALSFEPGPSHVHFVESGRCWISIDQGPPVAMETGDLVLLPHGQQHRLLHDEGGSADPVDALSPPVFDASRLAITVPGAGDATRLIGGLFQYERQPLPPVLRRLPGLIHLTPRNGTAPDWLGAIAHFLMIEANDPAPGSALMISRIIDLMVIRTLRSWLDAQPGPLKWLGGKSEERLARALDRMHQAPATDWTVDQLARITGMSRSVFADRFTCAFGEPPLRYLMRWRFSLASELLTGSDLPVGEISRLVGYESEAGFSRAFKAFHGVAPTGLRGG